MTLQFLTRAGCHLCDDTFSILDAAARGADVAVTVLDVDDDQGLFDEFDHRVPVIRDAAGRVLAEGAIDVNTIRRIVAGV